MKQETLNAFELIAKAALEKATGKTAPSQPAPAAPIVVKKTIRTKRPPTPSFNPWLNGQPAAPVTQTPVNATIPAPVPILAPVRAMQASQPAAAPIVPDRLTVNPNYSEKAFSLHGDEARKYENIYGNYGQFNPRLKGGAGYIFSKKRYDYIMQELAKVGAIVKEVKAA